MKERISSRGRKGDGKERTYLFNGAPYRIARIENANEPTVVAMHDPRNACDAVIDQKGTLHEFVEIHQP